MSFVVVSIVASCADLPTILTYQDMSSGAPGTIETIVLH